MLRRAAPLLLLVGMVTGCGGGDAEPGPPGPLDEDAFSGEAAAIGGGSVELSAFADQDLVRLVLVPLVTVVSSRSPGGRRGRIPTG